jgi:hypothetical protein
MSSKWCHYLRFPHQNPIRISPFTHTCHIPCPFHCPSPPPPSHLPNPIPWGVQITNLLTMLLIESSVTFAFVGWNILLTTLFWNTLIRCTSCKVLHPTPIQNKRQNESTENFSLLYIWTAKGRQMILDKILQTCLYLTNILQKGPRINRKRC